MTTFRFSRQPIDEIALRAQLADPACGGCAAFEGWVRDLNEGRRVRHLEYEAFEPLAIKEGERIVAEAIERFGIEHAACEHRIGDLEIGEMAVWVGVSARHRREAFLACRYIIDEVKHRVPIWKKEHYEDGDSGWVNCERCAAPSDHESSGHDHFTHGHSGRDPAGARHSSHAHPGPGQPTHDHSAHEHTVRDLPIQFHELDEDHEATQRLPVHPHLSVPIPDYSRQMALKEVGATGQARLRAARVLIVGCGGLGVPVISYLAGAGVGRLGLVDSDRLEPSNLHRQTMYSLADVGELKAELSAERVRELNPDVDARVHAVRLEAGNASDLISQYDLVIDCTDNFSTKFLLNDFCVQLSKPVIFSSVYQFEGQLQVVRPGQGSACLRCLWPQAARDGLVGNCAEAGVLGPVPGTFGSLQAIEALKLLLDLPGQLGDELLMLDLLTFSISRLKAQRSSSCPEHAVSRARAAQSAAAARASGIAAAGTGGGGSDLELTPEALETSSDEVEIVDIREPHEVSMIPTPFPRARHIPMAQLLSDQPVLGKSGRILLVCASGRRSLAAAQELRERGLGNVYSLRGGIAALSSRGLQT